MALGWFVIVVVQLFNIYLKLLRGPDVVSCRHCCDTIAWCWCVGDWWTNRGQELAGMIIHESIPPLDLEQALIASFINSPSNASCMDCEGE